MKVLLCGECFDIRAFPDNGAWVECRCGNMAARWVDPMAGTVKVRAKDRSKARIIGLNNRMLHAAFGIAEAYSEPPRLDHRWKQLHQECTHAPGYIFDESRRGCWACIVEVGHTNDISWEEEEVAPPVAVTSIVVEAAVTHQIGDFAIVQPVGNCDGSGKYAYDPNNEDGRGEPLAEPCPGCRACC